MKKTVLKISHGKKEKIVFYCLLILNLLTLISIDKEKTNF